MLREVIEITKDTLSILNTLHGNKRFIIKYNCSRCGKEVITQYIYWNYIKDLKLQTTITKFQCRECNCKDSKQSYYDELATRNQNYENSFDHTKDGYKIIHNVEEMKRLATNSERIAFHCENPDCEYHNQWFKMDLAKKNRIGEYIKFGKLLCENCRFKLNYDTKHVAEERRKTFIKNWGTDHPMKNLEFRKEFLDSITNYETHNINVCNEYLYYGIRFQSIPEFAFYVYYMDAGFNITKNNHTKLSYLDSFNKPHIYIPDFIINNELYEIKGPHFVDTVTGKWKFPFTKFHHNTNILTPEEKVFMDEVYERKHQCAISNRVHIVYKNEYDKYVKYVKNKYGQNFFSKFLKNNPYNPTYWCLDVIKIGYPQFMYFTPININYPITPFDKLDKDGYVFSKAKAITPFDLHK